MLTRVALDLLGGDHAPGAVVDGALLALAADPALHVTLVGPTVLAERLLAERSAVAGHVAGPGDGTAPPTDRCSLVQATEVVTMTEDPARAVRAKRDATVRVAARLVRDGEADAMVSVGATGAALAAGLLTLGRLPGVSRPPLAAVVPALTGPVVLLDAGAVPDATPMMLAQHAVVGAAFARVRLGLPRPRVGLLSIGEEPGKGDQLRKAAHDLLATALAGTDASFVGCVEGHDLPWGGRADVVVVDGFTGNVVAKALEGAAAMLGSAVTARLADVLAGPALATATEAVDGLVAGMRPDGLGGAVLLGVRGVVVVGHGSSPPAGVAACVAVAAAAARAGLVDQVATEIHHLRSSTPEEPA